MIKGPLQLFRLGLEALPLLLVRQALHQLVIASVPIAACTVHDVVREDPVAPERDSTPRQLIHTPGSRASASVLPICGLRLAATHALARQRLRPQHALVVHELRGGGQAAQRAVDATAVHLDVKGLASGGGPSLELLRAVEGDGVCEGAHRPAGVVDVAGVVWEGVVGGADPDVAEEIGGEHGGV